jgi:hypothetical protein
MDVKPDQQKTTRMRVDALLTLAGEKEFLLSNTGNKNEEQCEVVEIPSGP